MARIRVGKGRSEVTIEGALADGLLAELRDAIGDELYDVMDREGRRLTESARATWPVATGKSRQSLHYDVRIVPGSFTIETVVGAIDYSRYIITSKVGTEIDGTVPGAARTDGPDPIEYRRRANRSPLTEVRLATNATRKTLGPRLVEAFREGMRRQGFGDG